MEKICEIVYNLYQSEYPIKRISKQLSISEAKAMKILVTLGCTPSDTAKTVKEMLDEKKTKEEIATALNISIKSLSKYIPYEKGIYNLNFPSKNAMQIRKSRNKA